jgi:glycosyltransferase involved in cell wall biosynthesis
MKPPKVSVIIPTYNRAGTLSECVESVLGQTFQDYELIVVDDGSTDDTREALERYRDKLHYIYQENQGPSRSRNRGISEARGELIAFLDSDDVWTPDKLEKTVPALEGDADAGIIFTNVIFQGPGGEIVRVTEYGGLTQGQLRDMMMERTLIVTSSAVVRRRVFEEIGVFDETLTYAEDWDMFYRIVRKYPAKIVRDKLTIYRFSKNSMLANHEKREKLVQDTFTVLERIYSYPENVGRHEEKKRFYGRYYRELGESDLFNGRPNGARKFLFSSLHYQPASLKTYVLLLKTILWSTGTYAYLRRFKKHR